MLKFKFSYKSYGKNRLKLLNKSMILGGFILHLPYYALEISITIYHGGNLMRKKTLEIKKRSKIFVLQKIG